MKVLYDPREHVKLKCRCGAILEVDNNEFKDILYNHNIQCPCCKEQLYYADKI